MTILLIQALSLIIIILIFNFLRDIKKFIYHIYKLRRILRFLDVVFIFSMILMIIHSIWILFNASTINLGSTFIFQINYLLYSMFIIKVLTYTKHKCHIFR